MRDERKCTSWATGGTRVRTSATDTVAKTNQYLCSYIILILNRKLDIKVR